MKFSDTNIKRLGRFFVKIAKELEKDYNKYSVRTVVHDQVYEIMGAIIFDLGRSVQASHEIRIEYEYTYPYTEFIEIKIGKVYIPCPEEISKYLFEVVKACAEKQAQDEHDRIEAYYNKKMDAFLTKKGL